MTTIAIVSQKGGSGKTTLSVNLAAAAEASGAVALIIDTDPQATATQWGAWRSYKAPEVIDSAPPRIQAKVDAAKGQGATFIVIDTPPHADSAASRAVEVADLVLIPCRPRLLCSPPGRQMHRGCTRKRPNLSGNSASRLVRTCCRIALSIAMPAQRAPRFLSSSLTGRPWPKSLPSTCGQSHM